MTHPAWKRSKRVDAPGIVLVIVYRLDDGGSP